MAEDESKEKTSEGLEKVRHVVSGGLQHGQYYRVYVTQVNKNDVESPKSDPSLIRVGDVDAPPTPVLSLDRSSYPSGCHLVGPTCDVYFKWGTVVCDDLNYYIGYVWKDRPDWYTTDKAYDKKVTDSADVSAMIASGETSCSLGGQKPGNVIYAGLQAVDLSRNRSDVYVIRVVVEDTQVINRPTNPIYAEPYGIWAIKVWTKCSNQTNIRAVEFFRDGITKIATLLFTPGLDVTFVDTLSVMVGLTHYYTYRYIYMDEQVSPMSLPSSAVTAEVIDMRYINKASMEAFNDAWANSGLKVLDEVKRDAVKEREKTEALAAELAKTKEEYKKVVDKYTLLVNQFEQISAKVEKQEDTISDLRTSIEQTAKAVTLKASKIDVDAESNKIKAAFSNSLSVQGNKIEAIAASVSKVQTQVNGNEQQIKTTEQRLITQISQNSQAISLRATKSDIDSAVSQSRQNIMAQVQVQADRVTSIVSSQRELESRIIQLNNAIDLCVTKDGLRSEITMAVQNGISTAVISADRVVVRGEMLLQGNARLVGRLSANYVSLVDAAGNVIWGSDVGTLQPGKKDANWSIGSWPVYHPREDQWIEISSINYRPNPPVNFNGMSCVTAAVVFKVEVHITKKNKTPQWKPYFEMQLCDSTTRWSHETSISPNSFFDYQGCSYVGKDGNGDFRYVKYGGGWHQSGDIFWTYGRIDYHGSLPINVDNFFYLFIRAASNTEYRVQSVQFKDVRIYWEAV